MIFYYDLFEKTEHLEVMVVKPPIPKILSFRTGGKGKNLRAASPVKLFVMVQVHQRASGEWH